MILMAFKAAQLNSIKPLLWFLVSLIQRRGKCRSEKGFLLLNAVLRLPYLLMHTAGQQAETLFFHPYNKAKFSFLKNSSSHKDTDSPGVTTKSVIVLKVMLL
ncbi:hypothetical protein AMECASPLE_023664 [Ameca splendens]|uniref:Uncharacterized protein n=1 Tax=Ameca splendens TaxID=208324 RepID=A0ABV0Z3R7_9TELE